MIATGVSSPAFHSLSMRMAQAYLIESEASLILVDAGMPGDERKVLDKMRALGRTDLALIFITHAHIDHYGCAAALRRLTGAKLAIHQADAEAMALGETRLGSARGRGRLLQLIMPLVDSMIRPEPAPPDLLLSDGDDLADYGLAASVLHTPGHTVGSSSLIVEDPSSEQRWAVVGDLLTNRDRPRLQRFYAQDWSQLPKSLARLQAIRPDLVFPGHGQRPISRGGLLEVETRS